jgi:hypothetical protein
MMRLWTVSRQVLLVEDRDDFCVWLVEKSGCQVMKYDMLDFFCYKPR